MKQTILCLILCTSFACDHSSMQLKNTDLQEAKTNKLTREKSIDYMLVNLKLLKNNACQDTTICFWKCISKDSSIMIICDTTLIDFDLEKMLLESKYLPFHHVKGFKSFLLCEKVNDYRKVVSFFNLDLETSKAYEIRRFLVEKNQIKGLICLPGVVKEFMTTEEFDNEMRNVQID